MTSDDDSQRPTPDFVSGGRIPTLRTGLAHPHPEPISGAKYSAVELMPGYSVVVLDQRKLPRVEKYEMLARVDEVADAIRGMLVRGAPAIGIAAAYGIVAAANAARGDGASFVSAMRDADVLLRATRPTAVNLAWALDRMGRAALSVATDKPGTRVVKLAAEARAIHVADVKSCRDMGAIGQERIQDGATVLTHCNAGALATGGYGTALGVIRAAIEKGKRVRVLATETRPYLQGARLTAWELSKDGIPVELISDSMVGHFMAKKAIDCVVVGADRIAKNGDVANKIGTYGIACLAHAHNIPFYVAAPWSTVDLACPSGEFIPIEERSEHELTHLTAATVGGDHDIQLAPEGVRARNPSFDVTPSRLIAAVFTERGARTGEMTP